MNLHFLSAVLFSLVLLFSCQKEVSVEVPDNVRTTSDSIYLKLYAERDLTLPSGFDTVYKLTRSYDAQKRILQEVTIGMSPGIDTNTTVSTYFYTGNEKSPYKVISTNRLGPQLTYDTTFLTIVNGEITRDSTISFIASGGFYDGIGCYNYTRSGTTVKVRYRGYLNYPPILPDVVDSAVVTQTLQNNNVIKQDAPAGFAYRMHQEATYDTKPNPFYRPEMRFPILWKWIIQPNNVTTELFWDFPASPDMTTSSYQYSYRADGYPVRVVSTHLGTSFSTTGYFHYTN